jgi:hypothetical protein
MAAIQRKSYAAQSQRITGDHWYKDLSKKNESEGIMISTYAQKHYESAHRHLFAAAFDRFLEVNIPLLGGPELRQLLVNKIVELFDNYTVANDHLKPGQMLWVGVDKNTRADSSKVRYRPVVLTMITSKEITDLVDGKRTPPQQLPETTARILKEAYSQDTLLSMRDLALIFKRLPGDMSNVRQRYEHDTKEVLPTPATIQDMGSGITHKVLILKKILIEKKDMVKVRQETNHSQQAIDRYLKSYRRVEMLLDDKKPILYISKVTGLSPYLILQYENIYNSIKRPISTT